METRVQKWGNSLAVRIPKSFAAEAGLADGTAINITLDNGKLVLTPMPRPALTLSDLLAQVTDDNLHAETDFGPAHGGEAW
jgi:antitoxin MazE